MAENSDQEDGKQTPTRGIFSWTADKVLGAIIGTIVTGSAVGVVWVGQDLTDSMNRIMPTITALERTQMHIQDALEDADIAKLRSDIRDVDRDLGYAMQELAVLLSDHRDHAYKVESLSRDLARNHQTLSKQLQGETGEIKESTKAIKGEIREINKVQKKTGTALTRLGERMEAIQKDLAESRKQFSNTLGGIIEDVPIDQNDQDEHCGATTDQAPGDAKTVRDGQSAGDTSPDHSCEAAMRRWMKRASYFVRSLEIPTEMGVLKDTSVVKRDLRKAMRDFEQAASDEDGKGQRAAVRAALTVVESVQELASTGREY